ncbi:5' nucleotidase, NT5C type [Shewanella sp. 0m-8]
MTRIIYIDMDDVLVKYTQAIEAKKSQTPQQAYPQAEWGFFANLEAMGGGIAVMKQMLAHPDIEPYIATAPSLKNPLCYAEKRIWVEENLGMEFVKRLIIIPNKGLLQGDVLIDDNVTGKGQGSFQGELWQFGSSQYPDWEVVARALFGE